jgi:hypothetical protein
MVRKIGWGLEIAHRLGQFKRMIKAGAGAFGLADTGAKSKTSAWPEVTPRATPTAPWRTVGWASSGNCGKVGNSMMRPITCSKSGDIAGRECP